MPPAVELPEFLQPEGAEKNFANTGKLPANFDSESCSENCRLAHHQTKLEITAEGGIAFVDFDVVFGAVESSGLEPNTGDYELLLRVVDPASTLTIGVGFEQANDLDHYFLGELTGSAHSFGACVWGSYEGTGRITAALDGVVVQRVDTDLVAVDGGTEEELAALSAAVEARDASRAFRKNDYIKVLVDTDHSTVQFMHNNILVSERLTGLPMDEGVHPRFFVANNMHDGPASVEIIALRRAGIPKRMQRDVPERAGVAEEGYECNFEMQLKILNSSVPTMVRMQDRTTRVHAIQH